MTNSNSHRARKAVLVDRQVQGALGRRLLLHWGIFLIATIVAGTAVRTIGNMAESSWQDALWTSLRLQLPTLLVAGSLLPWFMRDSLHLSNRFAGPVVRLRKSLKSLADGEAPPALIFRQADYWQDLADQFNRVRQTYLAIGAPNAETSTAANEKQSENNPAAIELASAKTETPLPQLQVVEAQAEESAEESSEKEEASTPPSPVLLGSFGLPGTNEFGIREVPPSISYR